VAAPEVEAAEGEGEIQLRALTGRERVLALGLGLNVGRGVVRDRGLVLHSDATNERKTERGYVC
jgi:hypothetical protein